MKFKVKKGTYNQPQPDGTRKIFKAGEIVESDKPLHKIFKGAFEYQTPLDTQAVAEAIAKAEEKEIAEAKKKQPDNISAPVPEPVPEPVITLKAVNRGPRKWDVVKVVDGEETEDAVNDIYLSKRAADALVKEGWQGE